MNASQSPVANRGIPPQPFLDELILWGRNAPEELFAPNPNPKDIYVSVMPVLGPWQGAIHRRAVMLEVMRVLAGFESSWDWTKGVDTTNQRSMAHIESQEAGAWQVSYDSLGFGDDLKQLCYQTMGFTAPSFSVRDFIRTMKKDHVFAMEYIARLLRHTVQHNGPVARKEIHPWLRREAVMEFEHVLV